MILVIRQSGERTTQLAIEHHSKLFPEFKLLVFGKPGTSSHQNVIGLIQHIADLKGPFLTLDSDIFVSNSSRIRQLIETSLPVKHHIKCLLNCYFFGPVYRGALLFSDEILQQLIKETLSPSLLSSEKFIIRPFRTLIEEAMKKMNLNPENDSDTEIVGIHDFFQYRKHIFHKMINRAWREPADIINPLIERWSNHPQIDLQVAAAGLKVGSAHFPKELTHYDVEKQFLQMGFEEKENQLDEGELNSLRILIKKGGPIG
jgi:hypothetical protein